MPVAQPWRLVFGWGSLMLGKDTIWVKGRWNDCLSADKCCVASSCRSSSCVPWTQLHVFVLDRFQKKEKFTASSNEPVTVCQQEALLLAVRFCSVTELQETEVCVSLGDKLNGLFQQQRCFETQLLLPPATSPACVSAVYFWRCLGFWKMWSFLLPARS